MAPQLLSLKKSDLLKAISENPFPDAEAVPKSIHFYFLATRPAKPDEQIMTDLQTETESFRVQGRVFYLHTPDGVC